MSYEVTRCESQKTPYIHTCVLFPTKMFVGRQVSIPKNHEIKIRVKGLSRNMELPAYLYAAIN